MYWAMTDDTRPTRAELDAMLSLGGDKPDRKHAAFRLMGERLDPGAITQATGLTPDLSYSKGEPRPPARVGKQPPPWPSGHWSLDSEAALPRIGNHLEDHLVWVLDQLEPHVETIRRLSEEQGLHSDFWCGYFMGQANSGFGLDAKTLARIAALGADLSFDLYGENINMELETWLKIAGSADDEGSDV
jgi:Domain of unknown function (DUF4279)